MKKILSSLILLISSSNLLTAQLLGDTLNIGNVRTLIYNETTLFWDPVGQSNHYVVPKGSGKQTMFAGDIWMGGMDISNQLHLAAQTYRQSGDANFWPGPLDISNATAGNATTWNLIWKVSRAEIINHIANWNTPGYIIPASISSWPGNAPSGSNYSPVLAPFFDGNANQIYEPQLGEFPVIFGDQAIYFICNDNFLPNATNNPNMKIEVHGMFYAFSDPAHPFIDNTVFCRYQIINRSGIDYHDVRFGMWTDGDLGNANDDYFGTDVGRNMFYYYNGDSDDEGPGGYGLNPPAQGVLFMNHQITSTLYYKNVNNDPSGNPGLQGDYYQYMNAAWLDGLPLTYGADGRNAGSPTCLYMFPELTDPANPTLWTMASAVISPTEIRAIGAVSLPNFNANQVFTFDIAFTTSFPGSGGPAASIVALQEDVDSIMARYTAGTITSTEELHAEINNTSINIYPNPVSDYAVLSFTSDKNEKGQIIITSVDGKQVAVYNNADTSKSIRISKKDFAPGMYLVTAKFPGKTITQKMIIN
ncbi:MAG: T9SS type A sorting domain-containing protein [Bacteroidota bacterium]